MTSLMGPEKLYVRKAKLTVPQIISINFHNKLV